MAGIVWEIVTEKEATKEAKEAKEVEEAEEDGGRRRSIINDINFCNLLSFLSITVMFTLV